MWPARQQLGLILDRWQVSVGKYHDCLIHGGNGSVTVAGKDSSNHDAADSTAQNGNKKIERFATGKCTKENVLCCWKGYVEETSYWAIKHLHMNIISYTIYIYVYIDIDTDIDIDIYIYRTFQYYKLHFQGTLHYHPTSKLPPNHINKDIRQQHC